MSKKLLKISLGIPIFRDTFLSDLLNHLKKQTYKNVEYILSVDSPDNKNIVSLINDFKNSENNVKAFYNYPPKGPWENHKFIIENVTGDVFVRLDDDDYFENDTHLESLVSKIRDGYDYAFANVKTLKVSDKKEYILKSNLMDLYGESSSKDSFAKNSIYESAFLFYSMFKFDLYKKYFEKYCNIDSNIHYVEAIFNHAVAINLKGCFIPNESMVYRVHEDTISQSFRKEEHYTDYKFYLKSVINLFLSSSNLRFKNKITLTIKLIFRTIPYLLRLRLSLIRLKP